MNKQKPSPVRLAKKAPPTLPAVKTANGADPTSSSEVGPDMVPLPVFTFEDYRAYLHGIIKGNRHLRGFQSRLADAARCTSSFLTQVLSGEAGFSVDHLFRICRFLGLSETEWLYLRELLIQEKCAFVDAKENSARLAEELRQKGRQASRAPHETAAPANGNGKNKTPRAGDTSGVMFPLLHWDVFHLIGIPNESNPEKIALRLGRPVKQIQTVFDDWSKLGLIEDRGDGSWACTAQRFGGDPHQMSYVASLYKQRIVSQIMSGDSPKKPRFACIRLKKNDLQEVEQRFEEVMAFAWQRATLNEIEGNEVAYLGFDIDPIGPRR